MSAALRSTPPAPASEPRAKTLGRPNVVPFEPTHPRECEAVKVGDSKAVDALNRVLKKRGTSNVELAEVVGCPEGVVRGIRSKEKRRPFKVGHIYAVDLRTALALLDEIRFDLLSAARSHGE